MGAKKPTNKPRSIRYLLSADRRLQKISLRKIKERMAKTSAQPRSTQAKHGVLATPPVPPPPRAYSWRAIAVGATCLLAAAALMTARQTADEGDAAGAEPPSIASAAVDTAAMAAPPEPRKPVVSKPATSSAAKPVATTLTKPVNTATATPAAADVAAATTTGIESASAPITITGCLERDGDAYWLKDTSGADVPKSRSWKTGFLKKRSPRIELIDASAALKLSTHLGERVAATGTLTNGELRARSLRRVAASCN